MESPQECGALFIHDGEESMHSKIITRWLVRCLLALLMTASIFLAVAFLPGSIEGNYRGIAPGCGCDSYNFLNFRDGKWVHYSTNHPPAFLDGQYQKRADGSVDVFLQGIKANEKERLMYRAYPRFLITKFVSVSTGDVDWDWKWPLFGETRTAVQNHEIKLMVLEDNGWAVSTYYDKDFKFIRQETKEIKKH